jgi:hypothetical protein
MKEEHGREAPGAGRCVEIEHLIGCAAVNVRPVAIGSALAGLDHSQRSQDDDSAGTLNE